jgi:SAM-dependent methyltransferase
LSGVLALNVSNGWQKDLAGCILGKVPNPIQGYKAVMNHPTEATSNSETIATYESHVAEYIHGTSHVVVGATKDWIDAALDGVPVGARILELGSAFGRDAAYIASKGCNIECSDATEGFVSYLRDKGFRARQFNAITDELLEVYDLILANAVLLHFTEHEFASVVAKLCRSLAFEGRLAISLKRGRGEAWSSEKLGAPRFFHYWEPEDLEPVLKSSGFTRWSIEGASTHRTHTNWLFVIAHKS